MTVARSTRPRAARHLAAGAAQRGAVDRVEQMLSGVRSAGLKLTPQRLAIVRAIAADPSHPTAQEIFDRLQSSMPTMSFATVYNTLDALAHAGLCGSLSLSPGPSRFDPNMAPHHHAVCDGCGLVRDVPCSPPFVAEPRSSDVRQSLPHDVRQSLPHDVRQSLPHDDGPGLAGFAVRAVEHIYRGLCAACSARTAPGPKKSDSGTRRRST